VGILIGIDAVLFALPEGLTYASGSIPFAHHLVEEIIEVGGSIELVAAHHQAADLVIPKPNLWKRCYSRLLGAT